MKTPEEEASRPTDPASVVIPSISDIHAKLLSESVEEWNARRKDFYGEDRGPDFSGRDFAGRDFSGADLARANFSQAILKDTKFAGADLTGAEFERADLSGANLTGSNLTGAHLPGCPLNGAILRGADLRDAQLPKAVLNGACLNNAILENANLRDAELRAATLVRANLTKADLTRADLTGADIGGACFKYSIINGSDFREAKRAPSARDLDKSTEAPKNLEDCQRKWLGPRFDWESIKAMGQLPLFAISYVAIAIILFVVGLIDLYEKVASNLKLWAESLKIPASLDPFDTLTRAAALIADLDGTISVPPLTSVLIVSMVLLAIASSIYAIRCPPRIKSFSADEWCQLQKMPSSHYWAMSWRYPKSRYICGTLYRVGGTLASGYLLVRAWRALCFVCSHTDWF
jgi:uncharacterized protein YjbI with pentapeptide repeats